MKLSQLVPEQQRLTEKLRSVGLSKISRRWRERPRSRHPPPPSRLSAPLCFAAGTLTSLSGSVTDKGVNCRRLKDQLDTLERETTDKLAQMDQYNKELKVELLLILMTSMTITICV